MPTAVRDARCPDDGPIERVTSKNESRDQAADTSLFGQVCVRSDRCLLDELHEVDYAKLKIGS